MDEKPMAVIVTAIIMAPLIALCCLGPLIIGSAVGSVVGWLSGQGLAITAVLALLGVALGFAAMHSRKAMFRREDVGSLCECDRSQAWRSGKLDHISDRDERRVADRRASGHSCLEVAHFNCEASPAPKDERLRP